MDQPDPICDFCRLWETRLWHAFVLFSTASALLTAVALKHLIEAWRSLGGGHRR